MGKAGLLPFHRKGHNVGFDSALLETSIPFEKLQVKIPAVYRSREKEPPLSFNDLNYDVKSVIVSHVNRPSDLRNVCLTSHELHEIAVRYLYKDVVLDIGSPADLRLSAFLNPDNIGLKHIRKVDLYLATVVDPCNQMNQAHFTIRMLINFIPPNILEKFSWHPWEQFSAENLMLLYQKQKKLQFGEAIAMDQDISADMEKLPYMDDALAMTKKVGLYPDSMEVLKYCNFLVRKTPRLDKITIHPSFEDPSRGEQIPSREWNDSSTEPGLLTSTIFGHLMPFDKCTPMTLSELTLQKVNLRYSKDTYCSFIETVKLKSIRIFQCPGADAFFSEISRSTTLPKLLETLDIKHEDNAENDMLVALDAFLTLVSGIKNLTIDLSMVKTPLAAAGIARHGKTIRSLNLHSYSSLVGCTDDELVYSTQDFETICKACTQLDQISIGFPSTSILRGASENFTAFENHLAHIPTLRTLNITTWPNNNPTGTRLPRQIYEHLLQRLAQATFSRNIAAAASASRPPRLMLIAFGSSDKIYNREDSKHQVIFVKGTQTDPNGGVGAAAMTIGWSARKFVEPRSEVLDFSLSRSSRPPTKEILLGEDANLDGLD